MENASAGAAAHPTHLPPPCVASTLSGVAGLLVVAGTLTVGFSEADPSSADSTWLGDLFVVGYR